MTIRRSVSITKLELKAIKDGRGQSFEEYLKYDECNCLAFLEMISGDCNYCVYKEENKETCKMYGNSCSDGSKWKINKKMLKSAFEILKKRYSHIGINYRD